ncbi:MAG: hypothetical protein ACJAT2_002836 [Bacteriovoracaceae bacterium]|jgi:hypothetical protein
MNKAIVRKVKELPSLGYKLYEKQGFIHYKEDDYCLLGGVQVEGLL